MSTIHRFAATLSAFAVLICSVSFAQQQDDRVAQVRAVVAKQMGHFLQQEKSRQQQYLTEIIEDLRKTCGLSNSQVKKLRIAAKGAVVYALAEYDLGTAGLENLTIEELQRLNIQFHGQRQTAESVADQPIWMKTVERTLTSEQHDTYQTALENRVGAKREELTERVMKSIVGFVPMSAVAREKIEELVKADLDQTLKNLSGPKAAAMSSQQAMATVSTLPTAEIAKILSGAQMLQWRNFVRQMQNNNRLIQQRQMLQIPNVIQNGVIMQQVQPNGAIVVPRLRMAIPTF